MSRAVVLHYVHDDLGLAFRTNDARLVYLLLLPELDSIGVFYAAYGASLEESVAFRVRLPVDTVTGALRELVEYTFLTRDERTLSVSGFQERQAEGNALLLSQGTVVGPPASCVMAELPPPVGAPMRSRLPRSEDYVHLATSPMDGRLTAPIVPGEAPEERRLRRRRLAQQKRRDAKRQSVAVSDRPSVLPSESEGMASMASSDGFNVASERLQMASRKGFKAASGGASVGPQSRARLNSGSSEALETTEELLETSSSSYTFGTREEGTEAASIGMASGFSEAGGDMASSAEAASAS